MDGERFDDWTRRLTTRASRRRILNGLVASVSGAAIAHGTRGNAGAACPPEQVERGRTGCVCKATGRPPDDGGLCPCPSGLTRCADACVDLTTDAANCGVCGAVCTAGPDVAELVCRQAACKVETCAAGLANCDGDLVCETLLGTDTDCGACGSACIGVGESCGGGGVPGECGCLDDGSACDGRMCGVATTNCGVDVVCGGDDPCQIGQVCDASGQCVCTPASCSWGCCDSAGACQDGRSLEVCGTNGAECIACSGHHTCGGGSNGVCGCRPRQSCDVDQCGLTIDDGCGDQLTCPACSVAFGFTGGAQTWTVPAGVRRATFEVWGAQGGHGVGDFGLGGHAAATLQVEPGTNYAIYVGGEGGRPDGGFNGGGHGGGPGGPDQVPARGGGGASDVRIGGAGLEHRLLVAGGGGGETGGSGGAGGAGGGPTGGDGGNHGAVSVTAGRGGTATEGGAAGKGGGQSDNATAGTIGLGGSGGGGVLRGSSGCGGGGGYYGGGGGGGGIGGGIRGAGGGGGSGYITPGALDVVEFESGVRLGHGAVTITYAFD